MSTHPLRRATQAVFEALESRQLRSATLDPVTHQLSVAGTAGNDQISLSLEAGKLKLVDNGTTHTYDPAKVLIIRVDGKAGNDVIKLTDAVKRPAVLLGGAGNDTLRGGGANDSLDGGTDNDKLDGGLGADALWGGAGFDTADYSARDTSVYVSLDDKANDGFVSDSDMGDQLLNYQTGFTKEGYSAEGDNVHSDIEAVNGGKNRDWIRGSASANTLHGNGGNDLIEGYGGSDTIYGDGGADSLLGGGGSKPKDDPGHFFQLGNDTIYGGDGDDSIVGNAYGFNSLWGNAGDDTLVGGANADHLYGGADNDYLRPEEGDDYASGGDGDDMFIGGHGADDMWGGAGVDTLSYFDAYDNTDNADVGVKVTLDDIANDGKKSNVNEGDNAHSDIENLVGTDQDDTLFGSSANNRIEGRGGNDTINSGAGSDTLDGGAGNDTLRAKDGLFSDVVIGGSGSDTAWIDSILGGPKDYTTQVEVIYT